MLTQQISRLRSVQAIAILVVAAGVSFLWPDHARGEHDKFRYKFPCVPQDLCYVTQLAHTGNAFDFDPQGSAGLGTIPLVSEGTFLGYVTASSTCTWPSGSGLGKYAVIEDIHGRTLRYAHLSAFGNLDEVEDGRVLQGSAVGVEGNTGYSANCAPHLHLEGISTTEYIDGISTSSITAGPTIYASTNSWVSGTSAPAQAIKGLFKAVGAAYTTWWTVGWTADITGNQAGCESWPFCQLYIHYEPDADEGHWGSLISLGKHQETVYLGLNPVPHDFNAIMAGRWGDADEAYWVKLPFHLAWQTAYLPGEPGPLGLPLMDEIGQDPELCPPSVCSSYQRFNFGYVWSVGGSVALAFCPDVNAPAGQWPDHYVDLPNDIVGVNLRWTNEDGGLPYEPWDDARFDVNGDGRIDLPNDILSVINSWQTTCHPQ